MYCNSNLTMKRNMHNRLNCTRYVFTQYALETCQSWLFKEASFNITCSFVLCIIGCDQNNLSFNFT